MQNIHPETKRPGLTPRAPPSTQLGLLPPLRKEAVTYLALAGGEHARLDDEFKVKLAETLYDEYRSAGRQLSILHLGCGDGSDFLEIAEKVDKNVRKEKRARLIVMGLDDQTEGDKDRKLQARDGKQGQRHGQAEQDRGRLHGLDRLSTMNETFDVVVATFFPKVDNIAEDLRELIMFMGSRTTPGGRIAIQFPTRGIGLGGMGTGEPYDIKIVNLMLSECGLTATKFMTGRKTQDDERAFGYAIAEV